MNSKPLNQTDRQLISRLQDQLGEVRQRLNVSAPGAVLFRADLSYGDDEVAYVEADGFGGAVLRVVEGNYPVDYNTREEKSFSTEAEATWKQDQEIGLTPGEMYYFRVRAVGPLGPGPWSDIAQKQAR